MILLITRNPLLLSKLSLFAAPKKIGYISQIAGHEGEFQHKFCWPLRTPLQPGAHTSLLLLEHQSIPTPRPGFRIQPDAVRRIPHGDANIQSIEVNPNEVCWAFGTTGYFFSQRFSDWSRRPQGFCEWSTNNVPVNQTDVSQEFPEGALAPSGSKPFVLTERTF